MPFISKIHLSNHLIAYLDYCNIGTQGAKYLTKANWAMLKKLYISYYIIYFREK